MLRDLSMPGIAGGLKAPCYPKIAAFTLAGALDWIGRCYRPGGVLTPNGLAWLGLAWLGTARQRIALLINGLRLEPTLRTP